MKKTVPKAVIFDLGKVLLDFDFGIFARRCAPYSRMESTAFLEVVNQSPLLHRYESGLMTDQEFYESVVALTGFTGSMETFAEWFGAIFTPIAEMVGLHQLLVARGVPTFVFSNTNGLAIRSVRKDFPFYRTFTGEILSYEIRSMKPAPPIYEALEALTGLRGEELLYLDDRSENVEAGVQRGWTAWIHSDPAVTVPWVLSHWDSV